MQGPAKLRERLHISLRDEHHALDAAVSRQNLNSRAGFVGFLRMMEAGFACLAQYPCRSEVAVALHDLQQRALEDLAQLGAAPLARRDCAGKAPSPLAIEYVVGGSRLGGTVLRRQWESGPLAAGGSRFMTAPDYREIWQAFLISVKDMPGDDAQADRIVEESRQLFQMFSAFAVESLEESKDNEHA